MIIVQLFHKISGNTVSTILLYFSLLYSFLKDFKEKFNIFKVALRALSLRASSRINQNLHFFYCDVWWNKGFSKPAGTRLQEESLPSS
jgi:hypothetical protein